MLRNKIQEDITEALKAKNQNKVAALRLFWSELRNEEINLHKELTDEDIIKLLKSHIKKLQESGEMFKKGGRNDLYEENAFHAETLSVYLPAQLSDEALQKAINELIDANKDLYQKNPKGLIGIVMKKLSAQADSQRILAILNSMQQ